MTIIETSETEGLLDPWDNACGSLQSKQWYKKGLVNWSALYKH